MRLAGFQQGCKGVDQGRLLLGVQPLDGAAPANFALLRPPKASFSGPASRTARIRSPYKASSSRATANSSCARSRPEGGRPERRRPAGTRDKAIIQFGIEFDRRPAITGNTALPNPAKTLLFQRTPTVRRLLAVVHGQAAAEFRPTPLDPVQDQRFVSPMRISRSCSESGHGVFPRRPLRPCWRDHPRRSRDDSNTGCIVKMGPIGQVHAPSTA